MIVLSGALVLVALVLLVFGALDRNLPYVYASIGVSVLSLLLLCVGILQRRGELAGDDQDETPTPVTDTSAERAPALVGAGDEQDGRTAELVRPVLAPAPVEDAQPASRRVAPDAVPADDAEQLQDDVVPDSVDEGADLSGEQDEDADGHFADEDLADEDFTDEDEGSGVTVLVVSGRPRYHLEGCRVLRGKEPQPLDRDDARTHGFSPCGVCKPDADEAAAEQQAGAGTAQTDEGGQSFTEALFGEPLFADPSDDAGLPVDDAGRVPTSELPDRPVQPVLLDVEPAPAAVDEDIPPSTPLRGDDPADDPALETVDDPAAAPAPDVAANPDEPAGTAQQEVAAQSSNGDSGTEVVPDVAVREPVAEDPLAEAPTHERQVPEVLAVEDVLAAEPPAAEVTDAEAAPARPRASSRKTSAKTAPTGRAEKIAAEGVPEAEDAAASTAAVEAAPAKAPAKRAPAKKAPTKRAPAKKPPTKKAAAKAAPPEAAAEAPPATTQIKRPVVRAVRADALRLGAPSTGVTTTRVSARGAAPATGASVVVVPDRDRFHRPECRFVRGIAGAITLPKASASRQGYAACGVCKP